MNNPVKKWLDRLLKPSTHPDKKKREKGGYEKHKRKIPE